MTLESQASVVFQEEQRFRQPWLCLLLIAEALIVGGFMVQTNPPTTLTALVIVFFISPFILFSRLTICTEVNPGFVFIRFWPVKRTIPISAIKSAEARTYSPMGEYLGWGIKRGPGGKAYNVSGNRGVQLQLRSGERLLIGSQKAKDLAAAIQGQMRRIS